MAYLSDLVAYLALLTYLAPPPPPPTLVHVCNHVASLQGQPHALALTFPLTYRGSYFASFVIALKPALVFHVIALARCSELVLMPFVSISLTQLSSGFSFFFFGTFSFPCRLRNLCSGLVPQRFYE